MEWVLSYLFTRYGEPGSQGARLGTNAGQLWRFRAEIWTVCRGAANARWHNECTKLANPNERQPLRIGNCAYDWRAPTPIAQARACAGPLVEIEKFTRDAANFAGELARR